MPPVCPLSLELAPATPVPRAHAATMGTYSTYRTLKSSILVGSTMEDATYFANILRSRECSVCGADRKASSVLASPTCAVCGTTLDDGHALLAIAKGAAKALCSRPCLDVVINEGLVGGAVCPGCGTEWSAAAPHNRACRTCAKPLSFAEGYVGVWRGGRVLAFCGVACLEMHEARVNPFCG